MSIVENNIKCDIFQSVPSALAESARESCNVQRNGSTIMLQNVHIGVEICAERGIMLAITNKHTGERFVLNDDQVGFVSPVNDESQHVWRCCTSVRHTFSVKVEENSGCARVTLIDNRAEKSSDRVSIRYELTGKRFWVERRLIIESKEVHICLDRLIYGKLEVLHWPYHYPNKGMSMPLAPVKPTILDLGLFDRPRLIFDHEWKSGLFAGVAWWFYSVDENNVYQNQDMKFTTQEYRFESEPWYIGIGGIEAGEPYPGWLWYKTFLERRKMEHDKHKCFPFWNCGWGMTAVLPESKTISVLLKFAEQTGLKGIVHYCDYEHKNLSDFATDARENSAIRQNLQEARKLGIAIGTLNEGGYWYYTDKFWADTEKIKKCRQSLDDYMEAGYTSVNFDFFATPDTFTAHRNVTGYFRAAHAKLVFTTCDLGMAQYGPQFQREVLCNHAGDIVRYSTKPFSHYWTTFLAFRSERRNWLSKFNYLIPEYTFYYLPTPYSNPTSQKRYTDPEPQIFTSQGKILYTNFNFHDVFGFRNAIIGSTAFSPFPSFGYLELKMPQKDLVFIRDALRWTEENIEILRPARVCVENENVCVISKMQGKQGVVYVLNNMPGRRTFSFRLQTGISGEIRIRKVFPVCENSFTTQDGGSFSFHLPGESVAIFDINEALKTLPPQYPGNHSIEIEFQQCAEKDWKANFALPDVKQELANNVDPNLAKEIVAVDGATDSIVSEETPLSIPPDSYLKEFGFREKKFVATWKIVPWAFADRIWLVWCPGENLLMSVARPHVQVNGTSVKMFPKIDSRDYRLQECGTKINDCPCPSFFADITHTCRFNDKNELIITGLNDENTGVWSVRFRTC